VVLLPEKILAPDSVEQGRALFLSLARSDLVAKRLGEKAVTRLVEMDTVVGHPGVPSGPGSEEEEVPFPRQSFDHFNVSRKHRVSPPREGGIRSRFEKRRRLDEDDALGEREQIVDHFRIGG